MSGSGGLFGPGSQPSEEDGAELSYMEMPKGMHTYSMPEIPEKEDANALRPALAKLDEVLEALNTTPPPGTTIEIDLNALDKANRDFVGQVLGEGEVSVIAGSSIQAQEAVMAGIWRLYEVDATGVLINDCIEIGTFPARVVKAAQASAGQRLLAAGGAAHDGLMNAPAIATELADKLSAYGPGSGTHVVNLTLLPLSEEDQAYLDSRLGNGSVTILSRGYGNCRISSTAVKNAWRVRYFNSREAVILDTVEVTTLPEVACAAKEDLEDSAGRLKEILEVYR
ncbi:MAG: hydrogenase expression/formation C-terminal domain-containing protein [Rhodomicrobium sp.]